MFSFKIIDQQLDSCNPLSIPFFADFPHVIVENPSQCCALNFPGDSSDYNAVKCGIMKDSDLSDSRPLDEMSGYACYQYSDWMDLEESTTTYEFVNSASDCCSLHYGVNYALDYEHSHGMTIPEIGTLIGEDRYITARVMQCVETEVGCTAPQANNYNPYATIDCQDCCEFQTEYSASRYIGENLESATTLNKFMYPGCMDHLSLNFDRKANLHIPELCMNHSDETGEYGRASQVPIGEEDTGNINLKTYFP